jgi:hypothetical protein
LFRAQTAAPVSAWLKLIICPDQSSVEGHRKTS